MLTEGFGAVAAWEQGVQQVGLFGEQVFLRALPLRVPLAVALPDALLIINEPYLLELALVVLRLAVVRLPPVPEGVACERLRAGNAGAALLALRRCDPDPVLPRAAAGRYQAVWFDNEIFADGKAGNLLYQFLNSAQVCLRLALLPPTELLLLGGLALRPQVWLLEVRLERADLDLVHVDHALELLAARLAR